MYIYLRNIVPTKSAYLNYFNELLTHSWYCHTLLILKTENFFLNIYVRKKWSDLHILNKINSGIWIYLNRTRQKNIYNNTKEPAWFITIDGL